MSKSRKRSKSNKTAAGTGRGHTPASAVSRMDYLAIGSFKIDLDIASMMFG